jgi:large subunit ribosomal protein L32
MAVPKKKTSKTRRDKRRATWKHKAAVEAKKALSLGKSILTGQAEGFYYPEEEEEDDDEES